MLFSGVTNVEARLFYMKREREVTVTLSFLPSEWYKQDLRTTWYIRASQQKISMEGSRHMRGKRFCQKLHLGANSNPNAA